MIRPDMIQMEPSFSFSSAAEVQRFFKVRNITSSSIQEKLKKYDQSLSEEDRTLALEDMKKYLAEFAPEYPDEYQRMDQALSLPEGSFLKAAACAAFVPEKEPHDCTSWIVTPQWTAAKKMLLHKVRDAQATEFAPVFFQTPGKYSFLASTSQSTADPLMGINEKGLCIAMNSADPCSKWNRTGFGTPMITRILLENCAAPSEAMFLLEKMRKAGAYSHQNKGSIFFCADAQKAALTEMSSEHSCSVDFDFGYMIRANAWHLPGMEAVSDETSEHVRNYNIMREHLVRSGLQKACRSSGARVRDCFDIMRNRGKELQEGQVPVCRDRSVAGGTFEIDPEYPLLSTFYHACGPTRNTLIIPIPLGAGALPLDLVSGLWTKQSFLFKEREGIDHIKQDQIEEVEHLLCLQHEQALEQARLLLRMRRKEDAQLFLCEHLRKQFACAKKHFMRITTQTF